MKIIELTKGKFTVVDDEDYQYLVQWGWYCSTSGYPVRGDKKKIYLHRAVVENMGVDIPSGMQVDHIDVDPLNNKRNNLRIVTPSQNNMNRNSKPGSSSKYKGVSFHKGTGKWQSRITYGGRIIHLGIYDTEEEAARQYDIAAIDYFGEHARINL